MTAIAGLIIDAASYLQQIAVSSPSRYLASGDSQMISEKLRVTADMAKMLVRARAAKIAENKAAEKLRKAQRAENAVQSEYDAAAAELETILVALEGLEKSIANEEQTDEH